MKIKNKPLGLGTLAIPLLVFSIVFPLQTFKENTISLGEMILTFFNLPSWSINNVQGRNYTVFYAYFLLYFSLLLGCIFPKDFMAIRINKKILSIAFLCTMILLIILYSINTVTIQEPVIMESAYIQDYGR